MSRVPAFLICPFRGVFCATLAVLLWATPGTVSASPQTSEAAGTRGNDGRWYVHAQSVELRDLVELCSSSLGLPISFESGSLDGLVSVRTAAGLTSDELWTTARSFLASRKLAAIQRTDVPGLVIVPLDSAATQARIEPGRPSQSPASFLKVALDLSRPLPAESDVVLRSVIDGEGTLVEEWLASSQVLLAGPREQVLEAVEIVRKLDALPLPPVIQEVRVQNLAPAVLVSLLDRIHLAVTKVTNAPLKGTILANPSSRRIIVVAPEEELIFWLDVIGQFDSAEDVSTRTYAPRNFGLSDTARLLSEAVGPGTTDVVPGSFRIVQDKLTRTLLITASASKHEEIEEVFQRLNSAEGGRSHMIRAFPVRHRDAADLLAILRDLLAHAPPAVPVGTGGKVSEVPSERVDVEPPAPFNFTLEELSLTADLATNRILAVGPPSDLSELEHLIESIDLRAPQVLVEALVVSLTDGQTRDFTVELLKLATSKSALVRLGSLFDAGASDPGQSSLPVPSGMGLEGVLLDPGSFSMILRALETISEGRAVTVPKVLVSNHETANFNSVLQTPYTATNASDTVATTSFGGTQDAGTVVSVTPQITEGDELLLKYSISLSRFVGDSVDPAVPPPREENLLDSVAALPDGYAIVVGGQEVTSDTEAVSRVPLLGSIPLLGRLFQSRSKTQTRSRFFVFLRCSVLRSKTFEDLRYATTRDLEVSGLEDCPRLQPILIR